MTELPKAYEAKTVDSKWYKFWEEGGFFKGDPSSAKPPYCLVIPPPNVTGALHMGHALVNTLQDVLIRWKRMSGFEALWVPGTDHAGISTQTVVERHLIKTLGKKRKDFSREEFLKHVWQWKEENQHQIINQLKRVGCSCDWTRQRFTMDEGNNRAVREIFKKLYNDGLIYRGDYLVNWDPVTQTAIADDEVEYEERQSFLWHFKYPLKGGEGFVCIATTRPETILGDTGVAVSPKDARYRNLIGKTVVLPIMEREIPIIADPAVDPQFGTGIVKITPAHDPNDYQMGIAHKLPFINIMTPDGKVNGNGGKFEGLTFSEARDAVVQEFISLGLLDKIEPHINRVGISYRSKATIEPYMSKQWFVRMDKFAPKLRAIVAEGKVKLVPKHWENTYFHWIDNLRDWCISRQLWWGHRIPIWYNVENPDVMICYDGADAPPQASAEPGKWRQDEDVLDTWFSSALWPFAALGWPENTPELKRFYPVSSLITGHDILFFWVVKMIFMGEYALGQPPFPETFLHGLIYGKSYWREAEGGGISYVSHQERHDYELGKPSPKDVKSKWEKMSKSKGNIIDPIEVIDQYGTDAMRMALCASATQAREIDLDLRRFEEFKNFANKVWNGARFVLMNLEEAGQGLSPLTTQEFSQGLDETLLTLEDRWILSALNHTIRDVNSKLADYLFDQATLEAYDFYWKQFCSYYLEIAKPVLFGKEGTPESRKNKQKMLVILLANTIRLIHPMAPFITEELFQLLKKRFEGLNPIKEADPYTLETAKALDSPACIVAPFPQTIRESDLNPLIEHTFDLVEKTVYTIRNIRGEMKIPPAIPTAVHIVGDPNGASFNLLSDNRSIIAALVKSESIDMHAKEPAFTLCATGMVDNLKIMIPIPEQLLAQEKKRLEKEKEKLTSNLQRVTAQLENRDFMANAPAQLVEKQKAIFQQTTRELEEVSAKLESLVQQ